MAPDQARAVGQLDLDPPGSVLTQSVRCRCVKIVVVVAGSVDTHRDERLQAILPSEPCAHLSLASIVEGQLHDQCSLLSSNEGTVALGELNGVRAQLEAAEVHLIVLVVPVLVALTPVVLGVAGLFGMVALVTVPSLTVAVPMGIRGISPAADEGADEQGGEKELV